MSKKYITDVIKIDGQLLDGNGSAGTSGQVLSSTGTATDWVSLSEISGVDGSGTANYLAKWSDGDSITNSIIYDNGTNVGIGTTSPNEKLHAAGNIHAYAAGGIDASLYASTSGGSTTIAVRSNGITHFNGGNVGIGTTSPSEKLHVIGTTNTRVIIETQTNGGSSALRLDANPNYWELKNYGPSANLGITRGTTEHLTIDNTGNVGIGTTSPSQKLHVVGNGRFTGGYFDVGHGVSTEEVALSIGNSRTDNGYAYIDLIGDTTYTDYALRIIRGNTGPNTNSQINHRGTGDFEIRTADAANITFDTTSLERLRITAAGNVGIGTTSPDSKLTVFGDIMLRNPNGTNPTDAGSFIFNESGTTWGTDIYGFRFNLNGSSNVLTLQSANTTTVNDIISFTRDGASVGIGTTSPSQKLHVAGNARVTGAYYDSNNSAGTSGQVLSSTATGTDWVSLSEISGVDGSGTANYVTKWSDADTITNSVIYDNGTNVGIGTTIPDFKLDVAGDMGIDGYIYHNGDDSRIGFEGNDAIRMYTANSVRLQINSDGNVGIGTTSPLDQLHVAGTIRAVSPATTEWGLIAQNNVGAASSGIWFENGDGELLLRDDADNINVRLRSDAASYINGGNVGIGTTSPGSELEVDGEITTTTLTYDEPGALDSSAYNGEIVYFGTQISMTEGKLMVLSSSAGGLTWYLAKDSTTSLATGMLGIALGTTASAGVLVRGIAKNSAWSSFSEGEKLYLSPTGGSISNSITQDTNDFVRIVGYALGGSKIYFCPDNTYIQNS